MKTLKVNNTILNTAAILFSYPPIFLHTSLSSHSLSFFSQEGERLIAEKPELSSMVQQKLSEIRECWLELENLTQVKALQLFENDRAQQIAQNYTRLNERVQQLELQLNHCDQGHDLTSVNKQLKKLQVSFQH